MGGYDGSNSDIQQLSSKRIKKTIKITRPNHPKVTKKKDTSTLERIKKKGSTESIFYFT